MNCLSLSCGSGGVPSMSIGNSSLPRARASASSAKHHFDVAELRLHTATTAPLVLIWR
jgi:hypothetical protein